jgi:lipopolysaccharide export system protein LptA
MVLGRKFIIWFVSFAVVLAAFLLYRSVSNTKMIEITTLDSGLEQADVNQFLADSNAGQVGKAKLEYLERARFETIDAKTRKLKRVVGFEKVLHKTGNEWVLDKPYMNVFQDKFRCNITADTGTIEIENVEGSDPVPKSAVLKGNVVIHILPEMVAGRSDSFVYLNQITFDSDRSMFFSDDDVNFISADAHLIGKGLEVVYNNITNKLKYLKVIKVDFLEVKGLAQISRAKKPRPQDANTLAVASSTDTANAKPAEIKPAEVRAIETKPVEVKPAVAQIEEKKESFQCLFRDNARLEYRNEVVLADEIAITNILQSSSEQAEKPQTSASLVEPNATGRPHIAKTAAVSDEKESVVIATVKCDGPMIIRPDSSAESDDYKPRPFKKIRDLTENVLFWLGRRNVLLAQRVSYDYTNQIAKAHGQVELVFYPETQTYTANSRDLPFVIDAQKGAEFISGQNRAIFSGDVKGSFSKQTDYYNEENIFRGDKLVVDLASGRNKPEAVESSNISHVTVTGPGVRLESIKTLGQTKLSHVRLKSKRIDYDRITGDIIATGRGIIEYRNVAVENSEDSSSKSALNKPCYALVEGFDKLIWDTNALQVKAFSEKSKGVHIGYVPIENNGYGNRITIDTRQVDINYFEPTKGKAQLKELYATGGIVYYEQPKYEFAGKDLYYNAQEEILTVSGDKNMPCMLNGAMADAIEYNLKTGAASAVLGGGIGIMPVKE